MSCESKREHRRINIVLAILVALAATAANAGAPAGMPAANTPELIRPHLLDLAAPQGRPVSELGRPLRFDQAHASSATAIAPRQFTQTNLDVEFRPQSAFVIHWARPELVIITRNFRRSGLPVVTLWHASGGARGLLALGLSPRGVPGIYFTQKVRD